MSDDKLLADIPDSSVRLATYLERSALPYAFCPGCSHTLVVERLNDALVAMQLDPRRIVIVSDIGCAGIADKYFATHAFHGLHGRSVTYATGIKAARPDLHVIVFIGDGGCGIGGNHLISAARRNVGITVVVFNNFNFGMTGGQHSATTPLEALTATTPRGNAERPLDIASTVAVNGAGLVARTSAYDAELPGLFTQAIAHDGFALLDIWEMCTAYFVIRNDLNRKAIEASMDTQGMARGIVHKDDRLEFTRAYRAANEGAGGRSALAPIPLKARFTSNIERPVRIAIAGSAGQRVRTAGTLLAAGGVMSGLWASRRDDYPVTVRTGFSLAEVILSPDRIDDLGVPAPDVAAVLAQEGADRLRGGLGRMGADGIVFAIDGVDLPRTEAQIRPFDFPASARAHVRKSVSTLAAARVVQALDLYPLEAMREAARVLQRPDIAEANIAVVDAAMEGSPD